MILKITHNLSPLSVLVLSLSLMTLSAMTQATEVPTASVEAPTPSIAPEPVSQAEIKQALQAMQLKMQQRIKTWGKSLSPNDFERTWHGRQLKKAKRQEVCGIYQSVVNDTYQLADANRARLSAEAQQRLQDRDAFIQSLGFKDNLVDTQLGFNCRLR